MKSAIKSILTFMGFAILALLGFGLYLLVASDGNPGELRVTNVTDTSVTLIWETDRPSVGKVFVSSNDIPRFPLLSGEEIEAHYDDRDKERRVRHSVTITDLNPDSTYSFALGGAFHTVTLSTNTFATYKNSVEPSTPEFAYGSVNNFTEREDNPTEGVILFRIRNQRDEESQLLSTVLNNEGNYSIDLSTVRNLDGEKFSFILEESVLIAEALTNVGSGKETLSLEKRKPLDNLEVNVRYIPTQFTHEDAQ